MFIKLITIQGKSIELNSNLITKIEGVYNRFCSNHHSTITLTNGEIYCCKDTEYNIKKMLQKEQYDYKKNLEHLRERYINKIHWYMEHITKDNKNTYEGAIDGLSTAIHDIEDMLDGLEV